MGDVVLLRDYQPRPPKQPKPKGELVEFAKEGDQKDTAPSEYYPNGIDDLIFDNGDHNGL